MANIKTMKKKRVSKKTKISWRKHVNINDVEEYLEEKRADERLGDPIEILPDQQLFQIETKPVDISKQDPRERKKLLYLQTPKCFQILQPSSKVPDPISKRNRVRTKEERRDRIAKSIEESRRINGIIKEKDRLAEINRQKHKAKKLATAYKTGDFKQDLWAVEDIKETDNLHNEWNESDTIRHNFHGLGKLRKHIPESVTKKQSPHPNVELPHPGMSYNPSLKDHQDLLQQIAEKEEQIIKKEKHLERVTTKMFKKVTEQKKENSWLVEMAEGLNPPQIKDEPSDEENDYKSINPPVLNKKKDKKQRRKQKEQRKLEDERRKAKMEKKKISDIYRLKMLHKHIQKKETVEQKVQEKRKEKKEKKEFETKRLNHRKFEEPDLEFNMGQDIAGNLRNMKFEGNLLLDRFKSLQKRNILEPTAVQDKKKSKVKKFEKATHKMGWESKGY